MVEASQIYEKFANYDGLAYNKNKQDEENLLDLQVGGPATFEEVLYQGRHVPQETYVLP